MKNFFFLISFFLLSCGYTGLETGERDACSSFRIDRGFIVKWRELPIPIYIDDSVPSLSKKNFIYAVDMWNQSWNYYTGKGYLFEIIGEVQVNYVPGKDEDGDGYNMFYLDSRQRILNSKQQGTTHIRNAFGGGIVEGDIIINNIHFSYHYEKESFDYSVYTKVPELSTKRSLASTLPRSFWQQFLYAFQSFLDFLNFWKKEKVRFPAAVPKISKNRVDAISLYLHETGHLGALGHEVTKKSVMNPGLKKGEIRRNITETELSKIACGYGEL